MAFCFIAWLPLTNQHGQPHTFQCLLRCLVVGFWDLELRSNVWGFQVLMMIPTCNNGFLWCLERNVLPNNLVVDKWQHLQLAQRCWWILACSIVVEQTLEMVQDVGCSTWTLVLWKLSTCPELPPKTNKWYYGKRDLSNASRFDSFLQKVSCPTESFGYGRNVINYSACFLWCLLKF